MLRNRNQILLKYTHFSPSVCSVWDKGYRYGYQGSEKDNNISGNANLYTTCLIATNSTLHKPEFKSPANNEFIISQNSAAKGRAKVQYSTFNDILNQARTGATDMGAYNWTTID